MLRKYKKVKTFKQISANYLIPEHLVMQFSPFCYEDPKVVGSYCCKMQIPTWPSY